jgi:hypothetical protein
LSLAKFGPFLAIYKEEVGVWLQGFAACIWDKDIPTLNQDKDVCVLVFTDPAPVQTILHPVQTGSAHFLPGSDSVQPIFRPI